MAFTEAKYRFCVVVAMVPTLTLLFLFCFTDRRAEETVVSENVCRLTGQLFFFLLVSSAPSQREGNLNEHAVLSKSAKTAFSRLRAEYDNSIAELLFPSAETLVGTRESVLASFS